MLKVVKQYELRLFDEVDAQKWDNLLDDIEAVLEKHRLPYTIVDGVKEVRRSD